MPGSTLLSKGQLEALHVTYLLGQSQGWPWRLIHGPRGEVQVQSVPCRALWATPTYPVSLPCYSVPDLKAALSPVHHKLVWCLLRKVPVTYQRTGRVSGNLCSAFLHRRCANTSAGICISLTLNCKGHELVAEGFCWSSGEKQPIVEHWLIWPILDV